MAVQAIIYIEDFINEPSNIIHLSNAFLAFREAEKLEIEYKIDKEITLTKEKTKKEIVKKANQVRHKENRKMRELVIQKWLKYKQEKTKLGQTPSKTKFAQRIFDEIENAHKTSPSTNKAYSFKTIRNNWLQGV